MVKRTKKVQDYRDAIISTGAQWLDGLTEVKEPVYGCGIALFGKMNLLTAKRLMKEGFIDENECFNNSPRMGEFVAFMDKHPKFCAIGYAVRFERPDFRVTIEGLNYHGDDYTAQDKADLTVFAESADEFNITSNMLHAWWD